MPAEPVAPPFFTGRGVESSSGTGSLPVELRSCSHRVHLDTVLILAPSPPSEGGEGWGEEGRSDARNAPLPGPLPARASRGEGVSKNGVKMHPFASAFNPHVGTGQARCLSHYAVIPMSVTSLSAAAASTHFTSAMKFTSAGLSALTLWRFFSAVKTFA